MQNERTFQSEPPEFTIQHMVIVVTILSFVAGLAGWVLMESPIIPVSMIHLISMSYLRFKKKATQQAIIISCEPVGVISAFFIAALAFSSLASGKSRIFDLSQLISGSVASILLTIVIIVTVNALPKKWKTPVRHIHI